MRKIRVKAGHGTIVRSGIGFRAEIMIAGERLRDSFSTEEGAQEYLLSIVRRSKYGISPDKSKVTWGQTAKDFLDAKELEGKKPNTLQDYVRCVAYTAMWNNLPIQQLTADHIGKLMAQMKKGTSGITTNCLAPKTIRNHHGTIHAILEYALSREIVDRNVCDRIKPPAVPDALPSAMTEETLRAFLKAIEGDRLEALFYLIVTTGMRKGEAIALKWSDVNLETGSIQIKRRISRLRKEFGVDIGTPKSRAGMRVVQLPHIALDKLKAWKIYQDNDRLIHQDYWKEEDWVFTGRTGKWFEPRYVIKRLTEILQVAKLEHCTVHGLRHTFCTLLLSKGVPVKDVQEIAGHSKPSVTLNMYYSSIPGASSRISGKMDELLGGL